MPFGRSVLDGEVRGVPVVLSTLESAPSATKECGAVVGPGMLGVLACPQVTAVQSPIGDGRRTVHGQLALSSAHKKPAKREAQTPNHPKNQGRTCNHGNCNSMSYAPLPKSQGSILMKARTTANGRRDKIRGPCTAGGTISEPAVTSARLKARTRRCSMTAWSVQRLS